MLTCLKIEKRTTSHFYVHAHATSVCVLVNREYMLKYVRAHITALNQLPVKVTCPYGPVKVYDRTVRVPKLNLGQSRAGTEIFRECNLHDNLFYLGKISVA